MPRVALLLVACASLAVAFVAHVSCGGTTTSAPKVYDATGETKIAWLGRYVNFSPRGLARRVHYDGLFAKRKHGVSFEEASSVFEDPSLLRFADLDDPERHLALGYSSVARMLVVVHVAGDDTIRIIGARNANRHERAVYEKAGG